MVIFVNSMTTSPISAKSADPNWKSISKSISRIRVSVVSKVKVCSSVVKSMPSDTRGSQLPAGFRKKPQETGLEALAVISTVK